MRGELAAPDGPSMDSDRTSHPAAVAEDDPPTVIPLHPEYAEGDEPPKAHVRIRKLRVLALLAGLGLLAVVSTVFGMMMAVASDLPALEGPASQNSVIVDRRGERLGLLTGNTNRILLKENQIAPVMKHAIIAIEDKRFYTNDGVDLRGIGRALCQDISSPRRRSRAGRRSPSSSSRTRSPRSSSERSSRSCARPRSPTTSRASGARARSCATTSTRSTSATAPTGSSPPPARTSAASTRAATTTACARAPPSSSRRKRR